MRDGLSEIEAEEIVNSLWSLQYAIPNCVCGCGGAIFSQQFAKAYADELDSALLPAWSHAVHIRIASKAAADEFRTHPAVAEVAERAAKQCKRFDQFMWQTEVPSTLEDVYRQGDGWGEGFEHLLFVTENPRYSKDSKQHTPEMLSQLKEVAQGLRPGQGRPALLLSPCPGFFCLIRLLFLFAGCVQAVPGRVEIGAEVAAPYAFMARFREAQHLDTFTASAPYQALWEANPNLPGKACMSVTFNIAPADSQSTASFGSLGL
mmetsp:Transcript_10986/g.26076  ORF Transcript_10986/g.26076 Transcript_10986/m.26076 type:complete len:262 (-) Transcript_10986:245-1030(-)